MTEREIGQPGTHVSRSETMPASLLLHASQRRALTEALGGVGGETRQGNGFGFRPVDLSGIADKSVPYTDRSIPWQSRTTPTPDSRQTYAITGYLGIENNRIHLQTPSFPGHPSETFVFNSPDTALRATIGELVGEEVAILVQVGAQTPDGNHIVSNAHAAGLRPPENPDQKTRKRFPDGAAIVYKGKVKKVHEKKGYVVIQPDNGRRRKIRYDVENAPDINTVRKGDIAKATVFARGRRDDLGAHDIVSVTYKQKERARQTRRDLDLSAQVARLHALLTNNHKPDDFANGRTLYGAISGELSHAQRISTQKLFPRGEQPFSSRANFQAIKDLDVYNKAIAAKQPADVVPTQAKPLESRTFADAKIWLHGILVHDEAPPWAAAVHVLHQTWTGETSTHATIVEAITTRAAKLAKGDMHQVNVLSDAVSLLTNDPIQDISLRVSVADASLSALSFENNVHKNKKTEDLLLLSTQSIFDSIEENPNVHGDTLVAHADTFKRWHDAYASHGKPVPVFIRALRTLAAVHAGERARNFSHAEEAVYAPVPQQAADSFVGRVAVPRTVRHAREVQDAVTASDSTRVEIIDPPVVESQSGYAASVGSTTVTGLPKRQAGEALREATGGLDLTALRAVRQNGVGDTGEQTGSWNAFDTSHNPTSPAAPQG